MVTKHRYLAAGMGIVVGSLVVAACGGSNPTPTPRPAATAAPTATSAPQQSPSATPTEAPARPAPGGVAFAFDWQVEDVGEGAKPALALASDGSPRIAFMVEDLGGFVKYAERDGGAWSVTTLDEGYFYGPLDLAVGPGDTPQISWHDHQDSQFRPDKGDAVYAVLRGGEWEITTIAHDGHDGWDNRIAIDAQGRPHISAIDPVDFGGGGVEYYSLQPDGSWVVEQVSSKPQTYRFATSIAIDPQGNPHISYFDGDDRQLILASRGEDGWSETAIEGGNAGIFSSLIIDNEGRFHVSYYQQTSNSGGNVKYATRGPNETQWEIREIDRLTSVIINMTGARNSTSVAVDSQGNPWVAYNDREVLKVAAWDGSAWRASTVAEAGQRPLGQLVVLKLDGDDRPHLTYFEVTSTSPLDGIVKYAVGTPRG